MIPTRPYLIRAIYEWIVDNGLTPYILVDTKFDGLSIPEQYEESDTITFNVSSSATKNLHLGNDAIEFNARFHGVPASLYIPTGAVLAIYEKESGHGMAFQPEPVEEEETPPPKAEPEPKPATSDDKPSRPVLRVVK